MQDFSPFLRTKRKRRNTQPYSEQRTLERIEAQFALGGWCVGAVAGVLRALYAPAGESALLWGILGMLMVVVGSAGGCFLGYVLRLLQGRVRGEEAQDAGTGIELVSSMALGSGIGSFLGALGAVLAGAWEAVPWSAAAGALLVSATLTMTGDLVRVLMRMLALDSRKARSLDAPRETEDQERKPWTKT